MAPTPPRRPPMPLMLLIPLLAPEYLHSLPAQYTPDTPNGPYTPLGDPKYPLCYLYPFWPLNTYIPCQPQYTPTPLTPPNGPKDPYIP